VVDERYSEPSVTKTDMLGSFVQRGLLRRQATAEVLFQISAGSDTTATAIRATLLHLITKRKYLEQLRREIDSAIETHHISSPVSDADIQRLPFLQACVKEGLRIHPPFTGLLMKEVPKQGEVIHGVFIPGGTKIGHNIWRVQRQPIFGDCTDQFDPNRWMTASPEREKLMEQSLDLVFGHARWGCLGKSIAYLELHKVIVEVCTSFHAPCSVLISDRQLLRQFDFEIKDPLRVWTSANHNLFLQKDMWVKITKRGEGGS
jgi:cytochrome P450